VLIFHRLSISKQLLAAGGSGGAVEALPPNENVFRLTENVSEKLRKYTHIIEGQRLFDEPLGLRGSDPETGFVEAKSTAWIPLIVWTHLHGLCGSQRNRECDRCCVSQG
jgi:hypothetical protein